MSCSCVYVDMCDPYITGGAEHRMAEENLVCVECGRPIIRKTEYEYSWGSHEYEEDVEEGKEWRVNEYATCLDCLSVREAFFCNGWLYGFIWEDLWEHLMEVAMGGESVASDCITALTPWAQEQVCDQIEQIWEESDE